MSQPFPAPEEQPDVVSNPQHNTGLEVHIDLYCDGASRGNSALSQALAWELVSRNVVSLTKSPDLEKPDIHPLLPQQTLAFLKSVEGNRLKCLYLLAVTTGMRQGELLGLEWASIDLQEGCLTVKAALYHKRLVEPKTDASRRTIRLAPEMVTALKQHRSRQGAERLLAGPRWPDSDIVFTTSIGTPMNGANLRRSFRRRLKAAGLPQVRFHDLRHGCATFLLSKQRPVHEVSRLLGHSTTRVTLDYYAHVLPQMEEATVGVMSEFLRAAS